MKVLNLVINGIPSIRGITQELVQGLDRVLNLVINGIPSIQNLETGKPLVNLICFKPCYKWNTFNTLELYLTYTIN